MILFGGPSENTQSAEPSPHLKCLISQLQKILLSYDHSVTFQNIVLVPVLTSLPVTQLPANVPGKQSTNSGSCLSHSNPGIPGSNGFHLGDPEGIPDCQLQSGPPQAMAAL